MDEEAFRKQLEKKTVFRRLHTLDKSFVPEMLYCREEILNKLTSIYSKIFDKAEQRTINCLILGKGGIGKTCTIRYFGKNFKTLAIEKDANLFIEYFDCINFRSKSKIIRELVEKYIHRSGRGYSDDEAIKLILTKLVRENGYMLLILDDIHLLRPDEILGFLNIVET
jgi:Cdc6-like AAA superfamily ATPase